MPEKRFPVLWPYERKLVAALRDAGCPRDVPWEIVEAHERQALRNHDQTIARLAERGGLDPFELVAVLTDRKWREVEHLSPAVAVGELLEILRKPDGT